MLSPTRVILALAGAAFAVIAGIANVWWSLRYQCQPSSFQLYWEVLNPWGLVPLLPACVVVTQAWIEDKTPKDDYFLRYTFIGVATCTAGIVGVMLILPSARTFARIFHCSDYGKSYFAEVGGPFTLAMLGTWLALLLIDHWRRARHGSNQVQKGDT